MHRRPQTPLYGPTTLLDMIHISPLFKLCELLVCMLFPANFWMINLLELREVIFSFLGFHIGCLSSMKQLQYRFCGVEHNAGLN